MHSKRSVKFIAQLFLLTFSSLSWFVQISNGRVDNGSRLVQLYDCTCLQTFECTVFGGGFTIWQGSAFSDCQRNEIQIRHSQFISSQATGECNGGAITAMGVGNLDTDCYTSQLMVTIGEELINKTIKCVYSDLEGRSTIIGQRSLLSSEILYPPPDNIYVENNGSNQIIFAWDEVNTQCPSLRYVITAINCGVCPNSTTDTNITCVIIQSDISVHTNHTCLFAVQTEICGYLLGNKSKYVIVHTDDFYMLAINTSEDREDKFTTVIPGFEMVSDGSRSIVIPLVASIMSIGVILLLLVIVVLCIFMSRQVKQVNSRVSTTSTINQDTEFANGEQTNQEGIYSLLQHSEDNERHNSDHKEVVVYAAIGPNSGEQRLNCETSLCFRDDKIEYAEIKPLNCELALTPLADSSVPFGLNYLLLQIGEKVSSKWYQLGIAIGISEGMLDDCSNCSPKEAVVEVLDYWIRNHKPSWEDVAGALNEIGLHELANNLLKGKLPRQVESDNGIESLHAAPSTTSSSDCK